MIKPKIAQVVFPSDLICSITCLRFVEYYESPEFKGKIFTLGDYLYWYAKTYDDIDYFEYFVAFNFPAAILTPFRNGLFNPLSKNEAWLVECLSKISDLDYVIASSENSNRVEHELLHALVYLFPDYEKMVLGIVKKFKPIEILQELRYLGYSRFVMADEVNSYIAEPGRCILGKPKSDLRKALREAFKRHFGFPIRRGMILNEFFKDLVVRVDFDMKGETQ